MSKAGNIQKRITEDVRKDSGLNKNKTQKMTLVNKRKAIIILAKSCGGMLKMPENANCNSFENGRDAGINTSGNVAIRFGVTAFCGLMPERLSKKG